jgi:hypothetical protein
VFPDDRLVYRSSGRGLLPVAEGMAVAVYADNAGTVAADIRQADGTALPAGGLTVDGYSRLPLWQGPADGSDTLYVRVSGGPLTAVYARVDDRLDAVEGRVVALAPFARPGTLAVTVGVSGFPVPYACTLVGARLTAGTAPSGAPILVDLNVNGTTAYTTQAHRPAITSGARSGGPGLAPDVTALTAGDVLAIDIDQIGSATPGADLVVVPLVIPS